MAIKKTDKDKYDAKVEGLLFFGVTILVGLICAFKKIIYPVEIPVDIIGLEYSRTSDISEAFFVGILLTLVTAIITTIIVQLIINEFTPKRHKSINEELETLSRNQTRNFRIFLIVWVLTAVILASFTKHFNPRDFYNDQKDSHLDDRRDDDYFFK